MTSLQTSLMELLQLRARNVGVDWDQISRDAIDIVVFGSRAAEVNSENSDLDVLIVGDRSARTKKRGLDLVFVVPTVDWLSTELAAHICRYGVPLLGEAEWRSRAALTETAAIKKQRRLESLLSATRRAWLRLDRGFQAKYQTTVRRELQRLFLLRRGIAVPPTPVLDSEWSAARSAFVARALVEHGLTLGRDTDTFLTTVVLASSPR
jgi:predicted nucleotidyltransferase